MEPCKIFSNDGTASDGASDATLSAEPSVEARNLGLSCEVALLHQENERLRLTLASLRLAKLSEATDRPLRPPGLELNAEAEAPAELNAGAWSSTPPGLELKPEPRELNAEAPSFEPFGVDFSNGFEAPGVDFSNNWWAMQGAFSAVDPSAALGGYCEGAYVCSSYSTTADSSLMGSLVEVESNAPEEIAEATTVIQVRGLPPNFSSMDLVELLDAKGLKGNYDFVYAPTDFGSGRSFGYAFVNFTDREGGVVCMDALNGYTDWACPEQPCRVVWSQAHRGRDTLVERFRNSPVMHESMPLAAKPRTFRDGEEVPFPAPTKPIKLPMVKKKI